MGAEKSAIFEKLFMEKREHCVIATAKAVRTQGVGHPRPHHVNNQTDLIVCGCDSPAKTSIVQFCSNQGSTAVNTTIYTLHFESIPQFDHLYETWHYPSPPPVLSQVLAVNLFKAKFQKLFDYTLQRR